jgi:hypothetical protein
VSACVNLPLCAILHSAASLSLLSLAVWSTTVLLRGLPRPLVLPSSVCRAFTPFGVAFFCLHPSRVGLLAKAMVDRGTMTLS